jgi:acylphosphatase
MTQVLSSALSSGDFGQGGQVSVSQKMVFWGTLGPSFLTFAKARAVRLDLRGWIAADDRTAIAHVEGPEALVGAFEAACCIGPDDATVLDWTCHAVDSEAGRAGFLEVPFDTLKSEAIAFSRKDQSE